MGYEIAEKMVRYATIVGLVIVLGVAGLASYAGYAYRGSVSAPQSPAGAVETPPPSKEWAEEDCEINSTPGKCLVFHTKQGATIFLAREAQRVVILLPVLARKNSEGVEVKIPLRFALAQVGAWFGDEVIEMVPLNRTEFTGDRRAILLKDYAYIVRKITKHGGSFAVGFKLNVDGQTLPEPVVVDFELPPIPHTFQPDKSQGYGGFGTGVQIAEDEREVTLD